MYEKIFALQILPYYENSVIASTWSEVPGKPRFKFSNFFRYKETAKKGIWSHFVLMLTLIYFPSTGVLIKKCSENMQQIYRTPMPKRDFNKVALQLYWNRTLAWVFSYKFAVFSEHLFIRTPVKDCFCTIIYFVLMCTFISIPSRILRQILQIN